MGDSTAKHDELVDLKGALEQYVANTKTAAEVDVKIVKIARWWIVAALLIGFIAGSATGHLATEPHARSTPSGL